MVSSASEPIAIVLAAGKGTRMKSDLPKVLHPLCGRPMLAYVLDALEAAGVKRHLVVVGFAADRVKAAFADRPGVEFVLQEDQKGTGHAVLVAEEAARDHAGPIVVIAGDMPLVRKELIEAMLERFAATGAKSFLASALVPDPTGLGRIVRDGGGNFDRIVEQKDATPEEAKVREINASFYVFDGPALWRGLHAIQPNNAQGEYYLTDVPGLLKAEGETSLVEPLATVADTFGINSRAHLSQAHVLLQERVHARLQDAGVTIVDPRNTVIDPRAEIGADTIIEPFTIVGACRIGARCHVGPFVRLVDGTVLADDATVPPSL